MSTLPTKTVTRRVAAEMIGIAPATLKKWNIEGRGPAIHAKLGHEQQSRTLYRIDEIERWRRDPAAYERRHRGPKNDRRDRPGR
jgi:hypothetical protein